jgi:uncharacterized Zn finger protein (UPF0148 family)
MSPHSSYSNSNTMSNGKSVDEDNGKKSTSNIKSAADLLLKGGTLLSDSCVKCKGVQVRYKEETICVSCGRKIKETITNQDVIKQQQQQQIENEQQEQHHSLPDSNLLKKKEFKGPTVFDYSISNTKLINDKINFLLTTLENENDILTQYTKLDLISKYLEVLDKLKITSSSISSSNSSKENL